MSIEMMERITARARKFWKIAAGFPPNKEEVYADHATAQDFALWGERARDDNAPPLTALEYGCGGGSDTISYLTRGLRVVAVDINPSNVATTATRVRDHARGLEFVERHAVWLLEYSDKIQPVGGLTGEVDTGLRPPFDVASSHGVLHHIPQPLVGKVVAEIYRVLRPGGWFYAMLYTPELRNNHADAIETLTKRHGITAEEAFGWCTDGEGCPWAEAYSHREAELLFEEAGFEMRSSFEYSDGFFCTYRMKKRKR
jgi:SAM-dependent methyltransferase